MLFSFSFKHNTLTILHSLLNHNFELLSRWNNFPSPTRWAAFRMHSPCSSTVVARCLHLHCESNTHLHSFKSNSFSLAVSTRGCFSILSSCSSAARANDVLLQVDISTASIIQLF